MSEDILSRLSEGKISSDELAAFFLSYLNNQVDEAAVLDVLKYFASSSRAEDVRLLVEAEIKTGDVITWPDELHPLVDKHSTGGVGDKISLIVVPWVASTGIRVPKLSGRALGHTGGTIDKLESIPGVKTDIPPDRFISILRQCSCVIAEPFASLCPTEAALYEIRDRHNLIASIPLITASILSKKLAAGADAFLFDVKVGRGAFMKSRKEAEELANSLVSTARSFNKKARAVITSMEFPLGQSVGNSLEVIEALDFLSGKDFYGLNEVAYAVASGMLSLVGFDEEEAFIRLDHSRRSGKALSFFLYMIHMLGGPETELELRRSLPRARVVGYFTSPEKGYLFSIDPLAISRSILAAGRDKRRAETGIKLLKNVGDEIEVDEPVCEVHAVDYESLDKAIDILENAFLITSHQPAEPEFVLSTVE